MSILLIISFILISFFVQPKEIAAQKLKQYISPNHYSFSYPNNWTQIPKITLSEQVGTINRQGNGQFYEFVVGLQEEGYSNFHHPYLLVVEHDSQSPSFDDLSETYIKNNFEKISKNFSEYILNASIDDPIVDKERKIIYITMELAGANNEAIKSLMVVFLGKERMVQLNFYSKLSEYSEDLKTYNQIIDSLKYEEGYQYTEDSQSSQKNTYNGVFEKGLVGAVSGAIGALSLALFSRSKKKGKKQNNESSTNNKDILLKSNSVEKVEIIDKPVKQKKIKKKKFKTFFAVLAICLSVGLIVFYQFYSVKLVNQERQKENIFSKKIECEKILSKIEMQEEPSIIEKGRAVELLEEKGLIETANKKNSHFDKALCRDYERYLLGFYSPKLDTCLYISEVCNDQIPEWSYVASDALTKNQIMIIDIRNKEEYKNFVYDYSGGEVLISP